MPIRPHAPPSDIFDGFRQTDARIAEAESLLRQPGIDIKPRRNCRSMPTIKSPCSESRLLGSREALTPGPSKASRSSSTLSCTIVARPICLVQFEQRSGDKLRGSLCLFMDREFGLVPTVH